MHPQNAKPSVIFLVLVAVAIGAAAWLGFHNGNPEPLEKGSQAVAQGGPVTGNTAIKMPEVVDSAVQGATAANWTAPSGKLLFAAPVWERAELPPASPASSYASRAVLATATLDVKTMPMLKELRKGDHVVLPLGAATELEGVVNLVVPQDSGWVQVAGSFAAGQKGSFMLSQSVTDSKVWGGQIVREDQHIGYVISTANGRVKIDKKPLNAILCESLPAAQAEAAAVDNTPPVAPADAEPDADGAEAAVAIFDSKPGARGVLYLDFDGETVTDPKWNAGITIFAAPAVVAGAAITPAQIADICKRVAEDFSPFNITVTNDPSLYASAPVGERMHCIITPTSAWYPTSVGGITYTNSYRGPSGGVFSSTIPCWVFNSSSTSTIALTCSHELGHALGLSHDGTAAAGYYAGHDTGATSWGPIMGAPYGKAVTQWNNGTYPGANNNEDDLIVIEHTITDAGFVLGFAADEAGGTSGTAVPLSTTSPINKTGLINLPGEQDWYQFSSLGGQINFTLTPALVDPDLDTVLQLYGPAGVAAGPNGVPAASDLMATSAVLATSLSSTLSFNIPSTITAGPYYIAVSGKGRPAVAATSTKPAVIGYPTYGSVGTYTLTGTYVPVPASPTITAQPAPITNANQGTKVTLSVSVVSNSAVTYQWKKNGNNLLGKTASTLVFTSVQLADDATYTVEVKNNAAVNNIKLSDPAVLNVYHKPAIVAKLTPSPSTVVAGNNATFAVTVTDPGKDGPNVTNFVWKKNNVVIPVGTNASAGTATLTLPAVDFYAGGSYTCTVSNTIGSVTSTAAILTVTSPPLFKVDLPPVKHLALGGTASATVTVVGTAPFTYQWFKDGVPIIGATKSAYAWSGIKSTAQGEYWVVATGKPGGVAVTSTSTHMTVDVQTKPAIAIPGQPVAATTLNAGGTLSLAVSATGTDNLLYQWQFNSVNLVDGGAIAGSTSDHLTINPVAFVNQGTYRCIVTNAVGTVTSKNAVVTVKSPPVIISQPVPIKIAIGGTGVLKVGVIGTPPFKYAWLKDTGSGFQPVAGTTGTLTLSRATATATLPATPTEGDYKVIITNAQSPNGINGPGGIETIPVHVSVLAVPKFVAPLLPAKLVSGVGKDEHLSVTTTGAASITYQWQKNNVNLAGQTNATLDLLNLSVSNAGTYRCIAKNDVGTATSTGVVLSVLTAPAITVQPVPVVAYEGSTISFTVVASGSPTLTYQWYKDIGMGVFSPIPATSTVPGTTVSSTAKTAALKLVGVKATDAGSYKVTITNPTGSVTSNIVTLGTTPVPIPVIDDFTPHKARLTTTVGPSVLPAQIIMAGQHFNYVTKVRFVSNTNVSIPASFVISNQLEMIINIPGNLSAALTYTIALDDASGTGVSAQTFTPVASSYPLNGVEQPNNYLINAITLFRSQSQGYIYAPTSDNTIASREPNEYNYSEGHSVWFHWRPPATGTYSIDTIGCTFDSVLYAYRGPNVPMNGPSDLVFLAFNDDGAGFTVGDALITLNVIKGQDYYFAIDSYGPTLFRPDPYGNTALSISAVTAAQKVDVDPVDAGVAGDSESALPSSVGGAVSESTTMSVAWLPTTPSPAGSVVTAKVDLSLDTTIGTPELFSWSVYDRSGAPVFALTFDSATGKVLSQTDSKAAEAIGQVFLPNSTYQLTLEADYAKGLWNASLNGVTILEGQPLSASAIKNGFGDVGAVWVPAPGATTGGKMHYGNFSVYASQQESAPAAASSEPPPPAGTRLKKGA